MHIVIDDKCGSIRIGIFDFYWFNGNTTYGGYSGVEISPIGEDGYILLMLNVRELLQYDFVYKGKHYSNEKEELYNY